jgi:hypothetical protein
MDCGSARLSYLIDHRNVIAARHAANDLANSTNQLVGVNRRRYNALNWKYVAAYR